MKVSKTRRLKLLRDMEASREIHQRGYLTFSDRVVVEAIVAAIEESRLPVEQAVEPEYDPVVSPIHKAVLTSIYG